MAGKDEGVGVQEKAWRGFDQWIAHVRPRLQAMGFVPVTVVCLQAESHPEGGFELLLEGPCATLWPNVIPADERSGILRLATASLEHEIRVPYPPDPERKLDD